MQYALAASHEALKDSGWQPASEPEKEMTVSVVLSPQDESTSDVADRESALAQALAASKRSTIHP